MALSLPGPKTYHPRKAGNSRLRGRDGGRNFLTAAAVASPPFELAVAAALLVPFAAFTGALALLLPFTGVILFHLSQGRRPICNCFGQIDPAPIGPKTLVRNAALTGLALLIVAAGPGVAATWRLDVVFGVTPLTALAE